MTNATRVQRTRPRIAPVADGVREGEDAGADRAVGEVTRGGEHGCAAARAGGTGGGRGRDGNPVEALVGVRHRLAGFGGLAPAEAGGTVDETEGPERASNAPGARARGRVARRV